MADNKKRLGTDDSGPSSEIVAEPASLTHVGFRLKKNFGFSEFHLSHFFPAGREFRFGKDDALITKIHQRGASLERLYE